MRIIVCVKQVPDTTEVRIDPETNTLIREGVASILNPYDQFALEEGVRLRDSLRGGTITVLSMGPPQARSALMKCLALGADDAILLSDRVFAGADTWATSYTLGEAIRKLEFDLIICGREAIDGDTAHIGPQIAEHLNVPQITYVKKVNLSEENIICQRVLEDGYETMLGERGGTLSGGQRQCIAIARAIIKNSPIVIMDEPTSGLDDASATLVMGALNELISEKTVVMISHQMKTIRDVDRVYVMNNGRITQQGIPASVLSRAGLLKNEQNLKPKGSTHE